MREALNRWGVFEATYLPAVLRTFVRALRRQDRAEAHTGTSVVVDLAAGGRWHLSATNTGRWGLSEGLSTLPTVSANFSGAARGAGSRDPPSTRTRSQSPARNTASPMPLMAVRTTIV